tara:strand:+ start:184 stop:774 length:591 start_codon:yes stop_codon:yes gene_type:complete
MAICKSKKIKKLFYIFFFIFFLTNFSFADLTIKNLEDKKVSYLDFFLLKFENTLIKRSQILRRQFFASRVQYSNIAVQVDYDKKNEEILIIIYAIMDEQRYSKKNYKQKKRDCNQIRNLIFYQKHGYKFFTQKRDPSLSVGVMEDVFREVFYRNLSFNNEEKDFLTSKMLINVTIFHPIKKTELTCAGKVNDYELN